MNGIPNEEQILASKGLAKTEKKCPVCGGEMYYYDGGDQGGMAGYYCTKCTYIDC